MTVPADTTTTKSIKDYMLNRNTLVGSGAFIAGAGLQALGMFNLSFAAHNLVSNQILAFFANMVNAVAGNFLSAAAAGVISSVFAAAAIGAAALAIAYACSKAIAHFTKASVVEVQPQQQQQQQQEPQIAPTHSA